MDVPNQQHAIGACEETGSMLLWMDMSGSTAGARPTDSFSCHQSAASWRACSDSTAGIRPMNSFLCCWSTADWRACSDGYSTTVKWRAKSMVSFPSTTLNYPRTSIAGLLVGRGELPQQVKSSISTTFLYTTMKTWSVKLSETVTMVGQILLQCTQSKDMLSIVFTTVAALNISWTQGSKQGFNPSGLR
jgi:hypothetical protein